MLSAFSFFATGVFWLINPALLAPSSAVINGLVSYGANVVADYLAVRHFVLGFALSVLLVIKRYRLLGYFLLAAGSIQALDAITDIVHNALPSGPMVLAIVNLTAAYYILKKYLN